MKRLIVALLVVALVGVLGYRHYPWPDAATGPQEQPSILMRRGTIVRTVDGSGNIVANKRASLAAAAGGQLQAIHVVTGQRVEVGDVLAEVDNSQQELALLRARHAWEAARIDGSPNTVREREIDMRIAQSNLEHTKIRAPFSGVVTAVLAEVGESVGTNATVIEVMDDSRFFAEVLVDEVDAGSLREGLPAVVTASALASEEFQGEVEAVGLVAHSSGGVITVLVRIGIENSPHGHLRPGYTANAKIHVERADNVLKLPIEAVVRHGNQTMVTVIKDGESITVPVETGMSDGREVEVVSGLSEGDRVVAFNFQLFMQGASGSRSGGMPGGFAPAVQRR